MCRLKQTVFSKLVKREQVWNRVEQLLGRRSGVMGESMKGTEKRDGFSRRGCDSFYHETNYSPKSGLT